MLSKPGSKSQLISYAQSPVKSVIKGIKDKNPINFNTRFLNLRGYLIISPSILEPLLSPNYYKKEKQLRTNPIKENPENFYQVYYKVDSLILANLNASDSKVDNNLAYINFGDLLMTQAAL